MAGLSKQNLLMRLLLEIKAAEKAMSQRIDQALEIEARLIRRMALMADAERSLKSTMESVRRDVEAARPLLKPLPEIKAAAQDSLKKAMAAVEGGVEKALTKSLDSARKTVEQHAESLVKDLDSAAQAFGDELFTKLDTAQKSADAMAGTLHRRLESARAQYAEMELAVETRLREITTRMYAKLDRESPPEPGPAAQNADKAASSRTRAAITPVAPVSTESMATLTRREISILDQAARELASHRERVNAPPPLSSPKIVGRAPEYLRTGERRWRGQLVGGSIIEMSSRAA